MRPFVRALCGGLVALGLATGCTSQPSTLPSTGDTTTPADSGSGPGPTSSSQPTALPPPSTSALTITQPPPSVAPGTGEDSAIEILTVANLVQTRQIPRVEHLVHWDFESVGQKYAVTVGGNTTEPTGPDSFPAQEAIFIRLSDNTVVARYAPPEGRYIHRVDFYGKYAIEFVPIFENYGDLGPPTQIIRLDLETGAQVNLVGPLGDDVPMRPFSMAVSGSELVTTGRIYVEDPDDERGVSVPDSVCFTAIDILTEAIRQAGCAPDGLPVSFVNATDQGAAYLTYPRDGTLAECRHRYFLHFDTGEHTEIADGGNCRVWDGVELGGWQVWSDIAQEDNDSVFMENSTIYARSPENVVYTLGISKSTRTFTCGSDIYFVTAQDSILQKADPDFNGLFPDRLFSVARWKPGTNQAEIVYQVDEYNNRLLFTPPTCTDNTITVGYFDKDDNGWISHLQKEWFPARP